MAILGYILVIAALLGVYVGGASLPVSAVGLLVGMFIFGPYFRAWCARYDHGDLVFPDAHPRHRRRLRPDHGAAGQHLGFYFFPVLMAALGFRSMMLVLVLVPLTGLVAALMVHWQPARSEADLGAPTARLEINFKKPTLRGSKP